MRVFACLRVYTGAVSGMPAKTGNGFDLIRVLGRLRGEVPVGREVIASSDNLSARTSEEVSDWLAEHPRWRFVFTLKHASCLSQVEIFFSALARRLIRQGAFTGERDFACRMLAFAETYDRSAGPV